MSVDVLYSRDKTFQMTHGSTLKFREILASPDQQESKSKKEQSKLA